MNQPGDLESTATCNTIWTDGPAEHVEELSYNTLRRQDGVVNLPGLALAKESALGKVFNTA